jgi:hypothetical protein
MIALWDQVESTTAPSGLFVIAVHRETILKEEIRERICVR